MVQSKTSCKLGIKKNGLFILKINTYPGVECFILVYGYLYDIIIIIIISFLAIVLLERISLFPETIRKAYIQNHLNVTG